jgi:hypothetical protein
VVRCGKHGNEPSGSIKYEEFLDWLRNYYLLKDCASWSLSVGPLVRDE